MTDIRIIVPTAVRQSAEIGISPTLFDDYGSNAFNGEAGALALNDNWAVDIYDYTPQFAPTISAFTLESGAADETIVTTRAELASALNNATFNRIYCQKGDLTDGGDNDSMTLTTSGSEGSERQFLYYDPTNPSQDIRLLAPWNQAYADRVQMPRFNFDGADFTWRVGLSFGDLDTPKLGGSASFLNGASNNLDYRCNIENASIHAWNCNSSSGNNNCAFECVNHEHQVGTGDVHAFVFLGGKGHRIVSCEGWDILGDFVQIESSGADDVIVEDCDIYRLTHYDGNGNIQVGGAFGKGEGGIDAKKPNPDGTSTLRVYGCRISGLRPLDPIAHPGGGNGQPISFANPSLDKGGLDARWCISFDCTEGAFDLRNMIPGASARHSIVRCIFSDITTTNDKPVLYLPMDTTEVYLITVTDCLGGAARLWYNFRSDVSDIDVHDTIGCFFQDTGTFLNQGQWGTNWKWGYNAYAGIFTTESKTYPIGFEAVSKAALNMGDFTFRRKKLTIDNPTIGNGGLFTITGIVPTSSTPSGFFVTPTSGGDQIGSRTGIGVDDDF